MSDVRPGGNRRIDRVLSEGYLSDLETMPLEAVRSQRRDAEQEEVDLSYLRRLLLGRIDIVRAELGRRAGAPGESVVDSLSEILSDTAPGPAFGLGRHSTLEPSRADAHRRRVEVLVADVDLSDVPARTEQELARVLDTYQAEERAVSAQRRAVQEVMDRCSSEMARRYRNGEADVADLLTKDRL